MISLPPPTETPLPLWPGHHRRVGAYDLYVRQAGASGGEPAVFVHGLGGSSTNWTDLMALLDDRLDSVAPDLPGHGRSPGSPTGRYRLTTHVHAVESLLAGDGRRPVHLVGNSLGGAVATLVAARRPDLVRSLTLISPAFPQLDPRKVGDPRMALLFLPGVGRLVRKRMQQVPVEVRTKSVLALCYADASRIHPQRLAEEIDEARRRAGDAWVEAAFIGSLRGLIGAYLLPGRRSLWASAGRVTAPVQLIWGRQDRLVPVAIAPKVQRAFARSPGGARLEIFDDAGHVAQMEQPSHTAEIVREFLGPGSAAA